MSDDQPPFVKLAFAVLLSAANKRVKMIVIRADTPEAGIVEFTDDARTYVEMRPPVKLLGPLLRRIAVMANVPVYGKGQHAEGTLELELGDGRRLRYAARISGHGPDLTAEIFVLRDEPLRL